MSADDALSQAQHDARTQLRLTPRWTLLRDHPMQALYCWSPVRFIVNPSGRQSGKTELAKRKGVRELLRRRNWRTRIGFGAPSFGQAKDIFWQDLLDLVPPAWVARVNLSDLEIWTHWGAMIRVNGFDRPRRWEGVPWDRLYIDEIADCPRGVFQRHIRPALSTPGREGGADFIGVPDESGRNQEEYEKLWETGLRWPEADPEIQAIHWPSWDIHSPDEVEKARGQMDELSFLQEYGGRFVTSGGKALPKFDMSLHVRDDFCEYQPWLPIDWSLDFGTRWVASIIGQHYRGRAWVLGEIALEKSQTEDAVQAFRETCDANGWSMRRVNVFGDASGKNPNQTTGPSDYELIEQYLVDRWGVSVEWQQLMHNPLVKDTLNAVRGRICTVDNVIHLHMRRGCDHLIDNCKSAPWPDDKKLRDYHWLAALRYWCYALYGGGDAGGIQSAPLALPNLGGRAD